MTFIEPATPDQGVPILRTERLEIRPLQADDLQASHRLYEDVGWSNADASAAENLARRRSWLDWAIANERELARLHQPPLGDRAIVDRSDGAFVGLVGLVPVLAPFGQLPSGGGVEDARATFEIGLFWAIAPSRQRRGLATEAAAALIDYAFEVRRLARIVATTEHDNAASIGVMRRLGMMIERNAYPQPEHFQVVGRLTAEDRRSADS